MTGPLNILPHWFSITLFSLGHWNYEDPKSWSVNYPQCGGEHQSPINIITEETEFNSMNLNFNNYNKPIVTLVGMMNNGHYVEVALRMNEDDSKPFLSCGDSIVAYEMQALHFHWGSEGVKGSEHAIDGKKFDLEMHLVHKNCKYETIEEASSNPDGFLVLGILFEASDTEESKPPFGAIYNALELIKEYNTTADLDGGPIALNSFLPGAYVNNFFSYKGSLTTPPCSESVFWLLSSDVVTISTDDLRKFWELMNSEGNPMLNNFRPIQEAYAEVDKHVVLF